MYLKGKEKGVLFLSVVNVVVLIPGQEAFFWKRTFGWMMLVYLNWHENNLKAAFDLLMNSSRCVLLATLKSAS